jgi:hypothetical protein
MGAPPQDGSSSAGACAGICGAAGRPGDGLGIPALARVDVGVVEPAGADLDQNLAGSGVGAGPVGAVVKLVEAAMSRRYHSAHRRRKGHGRTSQMWTRLRTEGSPSGMVMKVSLVKTSRIFPQFDQGLGVGEVVRQLAFVVAEGIGDVPAGAGHAEKLVEGFDGGVAGVMVPTQKLAAKWSVAKGRGRRASPFAGRRRDLSPGRLPSSRSTGRCP